MRRLSICLLVTLFTANLISAESGVGSGNDSKIYIVYLGHLPSADPSDEPQGFTAVQAAHHDLLNQVLEDGSYASDRILHSYKEKLKRFRRQAKQRRGTKLSGLVLQGYNATQLALVTGTNTMVCANGMTTSSTGSGLNYLTMAARVEPGKNFTVGFPQTVTNVGEANAVYDLKVLFPIDDLKVDVSPTTLEFSAHKQKVSFTVTVSGMALEEGTVRSGAIVWYYNKREERSPVVVYAMKPWKNGV